MLPFFPLKKVAKWAPFIEAQGARLVGGDQGLQLVQFLLHMPPGIQRKSGCLLSPKPAPALLTPSHSLPRAHEHRYKCKFDDSQESLFCGFAPTFSSAWNPCLFYVPGEVSFFKEQLTLCPLSSFHKASPAPLPPGRELTRLCDAYCLSCGPSTIPDRINVCV